MKYLIYGFLCLCSLSVAQAQDFKLSGTVLEEEKAAASFATVALHRASDSTLLQGKITDENGAFAFSQLPAGGYFLQVQYVGMQPYQSATIDLTADKQLSPIQLSANAAALQEAVVTTRRSVIEVQADKTVLNVSEMLSATGSDGLEVLRKAPGVVINNDDNIILEGRSGVQIFIDGKPSPLSGEDLTNFLRSLSAADIEAIEVITQPSAKYDAAGTAGIINIRLKKQKGLGSNGTATVSYTQGRYDSYRAGLTFNNRSKTGNFFGSYNAGVGENWRFLYLDRRQEGITFNSRTETVSENQSHNARLGWDMDLGKKHSLGVLLRGNLDSRAYDSRSRTPISFANSTEVNQTLVANNQTLNESINLNGNLHYRYKDEKKRELTADVDYGSYTRQQNTLQPNIYFGPDGENILFTRSSWMDMPTDIRLFTAKVDYEQPLWKGKIGGGLKYADVRTDNTFDFYNLEQNVASLNEDRSNRFQYTENVNAAYLNYKRKIKKWSFQAGIRAEQTRSEGDLSSAQQSNEDNVKRQYLDWFPSGGLAFNASSKSAWSLNYSRRIQRPNYQQLNPFEDQIDELSFRRGNPFLQPQYSNNVKLTHTFMRFLTTSVSYGHASNFFAQITDTLPGNRNFIMTRNIADEQTLNFSISSPIPINEWINAYVNTNISRAFYRSNDEKFQPIERTTFNLYGQLSFRLPKSVSLQVSGWFNSPSVWGGTYLTRSLGSLDLAFEKKLLQDRLSLRLAFNDVLFTSPWAGDMQYGALFIEGSGGWDSRRATLQLSYNFGNQQVKSARKRRTGSEEENSRIGG